MNLSKIIRLLRGRLTYFSKKLKKFLVNMPIKNHTYTPHPKIMFGVTLEIVTKILHLNL